MNAKLLELSQEVGKQLLAKGLRLTTAESCTGGLVASAITSVAGSSQWFERGFVTYSNEAKQEMLGVPKALIERLGAVSEQVAREMAQGALTHSHADVSLSITGVAGPSGGSPDKPVGTVWFAWAGLSADVDVSGQHWQGDRQTIQQQAAIYSLEYLLHLL